MALTEPSRPAVRWPGYRHVVFDCDSTLSGVEGIDELAGTPGLRAEIEELTHRAMTGEVDLDEIYGTRLELLQPDDKQVAALRYRYKQFEVPDAQAVIAYLKNLDIEVYVVSGGIADPVREFAVHLGVPEDHVAAVGLDHDQFAGSWWTGSDTERPYVDFDRGALTRTDGKAAAIRDLTDGGDGGVLLVGDGESDLRARPSVDLFVGFAGFIERPVVVAEADVVIDEPSLAPIAALAAGPYGMERNDDQDGLHEQSKRLFLDGSFRFNDSQLGERFAAAMRYSEKT